MPDFFAYGERGGVAARTLRFSFSLIGAIGGVLASGSDNVEALAFRGAGMWIGNEPGDEPFPLLFADPDILEDGPLAEATGSAIEAEAFGRLIAILNDLIVYRPPDLRVTPLGPVQAHVAPGAAVTGKGTGRLGACFDVGGSLYLSTAGHCAGPKGTPMALGGPGHALVAEDWDPLGGSLAHAGSCLSTTHFLDLATIDPGPGYSQPPSRFAFNVGGSAPPPGERIQRFDSAGTGPAKRVNSLAHWVIVSHPQPGLWSCCFVTNGAIGVHGDSGSPVVWNDQGAYELVGHYLGSDGTRSFVQDIDFQIAEIAKLTSQSVTVTP
jgi:hypothetical protein